MLVLTPEILERAYDYLCATEPFCRWNLPESEDVKFKVAKDKTVHGWHDYKRSGQNIQHVIAISQAVIGYTGSLMVALSHEMVHMHLAHATMREAALHGAAFKKCSALVCKIHGFDPKTF